jgi:hypothetical protein
MEGVKKVRLRRLTGGDAGGTVERGIGPRFAGRLVRDGTCEFVGEEKVEGVVVESGKAGFGLKDSEAVIVDVV